MATFYKYWAKSDGEAGAERIHLLPYHSLDVAAVLLAVAEAKPRWIERIAKIAGSNSEQILPWLVFFSALHDAGKFGDGFQNLQPEVLWRLQKRNSNRDYIVRHDTLGYVLWNEVLRKQLIERGIVERDRGSRRPSSSQINTDIFARAVMGHHGTPPDNVNSNLFNAHFRVPEDKQAACEFVDGLIQLLVPGLVFPEIDPHKLKLASWWIAGLTVFCDWVGSATPPEEFCDVEVPLNQYWEQTQNKMRERLETIEIKNRAPNPQLDLANLIGVTQAAVTPTPLQDTVTSIPVSTKPQLYILEDLTGSGKTEAAILLAHRIMAAGGAQGLYMGLPTMATSNAMYERIATNYKKLFSENSNPSLVLAHSARKLSATFAQALTVAVGSKNHSSLNSHQLGQTSAAHCSFWLGDNRKKALLADVGVGTIDQALLATLPARHQSLRLLGLLDKVLIVDEVHAYDTYMNELLAALLEGHAMGGGSAVLLSATLPAKQKRQFIRAFRAGIDPKDDEGERGAEDAVPYPLCTQVSADSFKETALHCKPGLARRVDVEFCHCEEDVINKLVEQAHAGHCACWIRNTVKDAQASFEAIRRHDGVEVELFTARFALADRLRIEERVLNNFGPRSRAEQRRGKIVVATQVIEQSMDLDFDFMVSDLAPVDLLIQRAGRLRRHARDNTGTRCDGPDQRGEPRLLVLAPPHSDDPESTWLRSILPGTAAVYRNQDGILWLGQRWLAEHSGFSMPEDARTLIEFVYGDEADMNVAGELLDSVFTKQGEDAADASIGMANALKLTAGYVRNAANRWWDEEYTPTRLGEATTNVFLARDLGDRIEPWINTGAQRWFRSSLRVRSSTFAQGVDRLTSEEREQIMAELPGAGRGGDLLLLREAGDGWWLGQGNGCDGQLKNFRYHAELGLSW